MQHPKQRIGVNRLGHKVDHARLHALLAVFHHRVRRHRDNRYRVPTRLCTNRACRRQAVHFRHLHVHQNQVVGLRRRLQHGQGNAPVVGNVHFEPGVAQQFTGHLLVQRVVFGQQDARAENGAQIGYADRRICRLVDGCICCATQQGDHGVKQRRRCHGFVQHGADAGCARLGCRFFAAVGREHRQHGWLCQWQLLQSQRSFNAVQAGHLQVQQHDVKGRLLRIGQCHSCQRRLATVGHLDLQVHRSQHVAQHQPSRIQIVHDQNAALAHVDHRMRCARRGGPDPQARREPKARPLAQHAIDPDFTPHLLGQDFGERQA